jgi:hypothetical protein
MSMGDAIARREERRCRCGGRNIDPHRTLISNERRKAFNGK